MKPKMTKLSAGDKYVSGEDYAKASRLPILESLKHEGYLCMLTGVV